MSNALRNSIQHLAADFASAVLKAIRGASLEDILTESQATGATHAAVAPRRGPGRPRRNPVAAPASAPAAAPAPAARKSARNGRLGRRSPSDIANVVKRIVELLDSHPAGLRAEQIRTSLGLQSKELPRPITEALDSNKISKVGEKRATTYFAGRGRSGAAPAKGAKVAKTVSRKRGRKAAKSS